MSCDVHGRFDHDDSCLGCVFTLRMRHDALAARVKVLEGNLEVAWDGLAGNAFDMHLLQTAQQRVKELEAQLANPPPYVDCICSGCPRKVPQAWASGMCGPCADEDCEHADGAKARIAELRDSETKLLSANMMLRPARRLAEARVKELEAKLVGMTSERDAEREISQMWAAKHDAVVETLGQLTKDLLDFDCLDPDEDDEDEHADECWHCIERARIAAGIRKRAEKVKALRDGWDPASLAFTSMDVEWRALNALADDLEGKDGRSLESEP